MNCKRSNIGSVSRAALARIEAIGLDMIFPPGPSSQIDGTDDELPIEFPLNLTIEFALNLVFRTESCSDLSLLGWFLTFLERWRCSTAS